MLTLLSYIEIIISLLYTSYKYVMPCVNREVAK